MAAPLAGLLAALCLACALTGSLATRLPDDQAFVSVDLQHGSRRYILEGSPAHTAAIAPAPAPLLATASNLTATPGDKAGMGAQGQGVVKFAASTYDNNQISDDKVLATGASCNVYKTGTKLQCTSKVPVPACCDGSSSSATCFTFDSGKSLECVTSAPYPACCTARAQPASVCRKPDRSTSKCDTSTPIPACCTSAGVCAVFTDASDVRCSSSNTPGCCPA